jgi:hypothetical protein
MTRTLCVLLAVVTLALAGCDMAAFAAGSTIKVFVRAAPAIQRYRDPELAEAAMPGSIAQLEGVMSIKTEDADLRALLGRSYGSYGYAFLEDHMEEAAARDDQAQVEHFRSRASMAYARGKEVEMEMMTVWNDEDGGAQGAYSRGIDAWKRYLAEFDDEDQAPVLFWCAYNWARYIGVNRSDMNAVADLEFVRELANRVLQLDRSYFDYAPLALHAGLLATIPAAVGGQPEVAKVELEQAIQLTQRKNLLFLVTEAQLVAVALQDRALYRALLQEVIDAGDIDPANRLPNLLARRRAIRYLARIDELFEPVAGEAPAAAPQGNCDEPGPNESFDDFNRRCTVMEPGAEATTPTPEPTPEPVAVTTPEVPATPATPARTTRPARGARPATTPATP